MRETVQYFAVLMNSCIRAHANQRNHKEKQLISPRTVKITTALSLVEKWLLPLLLCFFFLQSTSNKWSQRLQRTFNESWKRIYCLIQLVNCQDIAINISDAFKTLLCPHLEFQRTDAIFNETNITQRKYNNKNRIYIIELKRKKKSNLNMRIEIHPYYTTSVGQNGVNRQDTFGSFHGNTMILWPFAYNC